MMFDVLVIGGSAGSLQDLIAIMKALPKKFSYAVIIVIHRVKNVSSELRQILTENLHGEKVIEPEDKESIRENFIYLAPQNYHLLIEEDRTFSLDYSELVNYSRPAIDVTFECVASVFGDKAVAVLLSGANEDGAAGLSKVIEKGGRGIVVDPNTITYKVMPQAAINKNKGVSILSIENIIHYIREHTN